MLEVRRDTLGYVSQFLRVIPRVGALDIVAEPLHRAAACRARRRALAPRRRALLHAPQPAASACDLPPATFSGGEQQRVNIARGFVRRLPVLLLDEPTASLDAANRAVVIDLIREAKARGAAIVGIFHDAEVRDRVADRLLRRRARCHERRMTDRDHPDQRPARAARRGAARHACVMRDGRIAEVAARPQPRCPARWTWTATT